MRSLTRTLPRSRATAARFAPSAGRRRWLTSCDAAWRTIPVPLLASLVTYLAALMDNGGVRWREAPRAALAIGCVVLATATGAAALLGIRSALVRAGRHAARRDRLATRVVAAMVLVASASAVSQPADGVVVAWLLLMATPGVAFSMLDGGGAWDLVKRLGVAVLALAPATVLAVAAGWTTIAFAVGQHPTVVVTFAVAVGTVVGHVIVLVPATFVGQRDDGEAPRPARERGSAPAGPHQDRCTSQRQHAGQHGRRPATAVRQVIDRHG